MKLYETDDGSILERVDISFLPYYDIIWGYCSVKTLIFSTLNIDELSQNIY